MQDADWRYCTRFRAGTLKLAALYWMTTRQLQLIRKHGNILLNDNTNESNMYGSPFRLLTTVDGAIRNRLVAQGCMEGD